MRRSPHALFALSLSAIAAAPGIVAAQPPAPGAQQPARPQSAPPTADDFVPSPRGTPDGRISGGTRGLGKAKPAPPGYDAAGPATRSLSGAAVK